MKEIMIMMASLKSKEELAVEVHDLTRQFIEDPEDEEIRKKMVFYCQLMVLKEVVGDDFEKAMDMIKDIDHIGKMFKGSKPSQN